MWNMEIMEGIVYMFGMLCLVLIVRIRTKK